MNFSDNIKITVIDTQINPEYFEQDAGITVINPDNISPEQGISHGTICCKIIRKYCPRAKIYNYVILQQNKGKVEALINALKWCLVNDIDIVNISLGTTFMEDAVKVSSLCAALFQKGIVIVAAQNNYGRITYPAVFPTVFAVQEAQNKDINEKYVSKSPLSQHGTNLLANGRHTLELSSSMEYTTHGSNSYATAFTTAYLAEKICQPQSNNIKRIVDYFEIQEMALTYHALLGLQNAAMILPSNLSIYESTFRKMLPIKYVTYSITDPTLCVADNIFIISQGANQNYQMNYSISTSKNVIYLDLDGLTNSFTWFSKAGRPWKYQLYIPPFHLNSTPLNVPIISLLILDNTTNAHLIPYMLLEQFKHNQFVVAGYSNLLYELCCGYDLITDIHKEQDFCSFLYKSRSCDLILNTYTVENSEIFEDYLKKNIADLILVIENNSVISISSKSYVKFILHDPKESSELLYNHIIQIFNTDCT